ncbi:MAG: 30S ribosomal protein S20 [Candidatus Latescibacterota bacterium]|nr:MAG: 30S ribosomal protein S20 [Candidatus Latescibacteria bacterium 4484_107]RKY68260.1 MAG: 30S ribosomal protein S20 [Candidatus Latescibacterota bacterium]
MPQIKSAKKRVITDRKANLRNRRIRSEMKSAIKTVRTAANREEGEQALLRAVSTIDRTAAKGIVHKNTAARTKSRLAHFVARMD